MRTEETVVTVINNDDGTISVEGQKGKFTQKLIRSLGLRIPQMNVSRSFRTEEANGATMTRLTGQAVIDRDRLGRIGLPEYASELVVGLLPSSDASHHWRGSIGFIPYDWEFIGEETYFCEIYIPTTAFDELIREHDQGKLRNLEIFLHTDLWGFDYDYYAPPSGKVSWHLPPDHNGNATRAGLGAVKVEVFRWSDEKIQPRVASKRLPAPGKTGELFHVEPPLTH